MKTWIVYVHVFPNGKKYFGITSKKPNQRWENGEGYKREGSNLAVYNAIKKYGWDNIQHIILHEGLTKEEACAKEIEYIAKYKTNVHRYGSKYGYNLTDGGEGATGHKVPKELIDKIIEINRTRKGAKCYKSKAVICDDKEWETLSECAADIGVNREAVRQWLIGGKGMPVEWYNKHLRFKEGNYTSFLQDKPHKYKIEYNGEIFESQNKFAEYIGVSPALVCRWIKNNNVPQKYLEKGFKRIE